MPTYDETVGAAIIGWNNESGGDWFKIQRALNAVTARANHSVPTDNGYFTVADVIQMMDFPAGCIFFYSVFRTVVAGTTSGVVCDLGEDGGVIFGDDVSLYATAGTVVVGTVTDANGENFHSAANTADLTVRTQNLLTGSYVWSLLGNHSV